jgi:hypothetical protein
LNPRGFYTLSVFKTDPFSLLGIPPFNNQLYLMTVVDPVGFEPTTDRL